MLRYFSKVKNFYEIYFYHLDTVFAGVITFAIAYWEFKCPYYTPAKSQAELSNFFITIASISGTLIGFNIAAMTFLAGLIEKSRFDALRKNKKTKLIWKCSNSLSLNLFLVASICLLFLMYDFAEQPYTVLAYFLIFFIALSILRLIKITRIITMFVSILHA